MKLWICDECGWSTTDYPPYALCCSVKPHTGSYKMRVIDETSDREICAAAGVKPEHLDYVFGPKLYCIRYADGHLGEERTWESALKLIYNGRVWRRRGGPDLMLAVRVEEA